MASGDTLGVVMQSDIEQTPSDSSTKIVSSVGIKTALDGKQNTLTFDSAPTEGSANPVTSGGVKTALDAKQPKTLATPLTINGTQQTTVESALGGLNDGLNADVAPLYTPKTLTGSVVTFDDGLDGALLGGLSLAIEPVQSGSGNPSPTNVRPITGWTAATVKRYGTDESDNLLIINVPFGQTIYGGTLDVLSGKLTVTKGIADLGDLTYNYDNTNKDFYTTSLASVIGPAEQDKAPEITTDRFKLVSRNYFISTSKTEDFLLFENSTKTVGIRWLAYNDVTAFKAAVSGSMLVYPLATPLTYYLTPREIRTLLGLNNIYADTGNVSVTYRGDVLNLYEKVADMKNDLSAFFANIAPIDDSPTASAPIQAYQLMMHNGRLYKTTRAIATDEMYVVAESMNDANGNIIPTSLGAEINIINSHFND